jgi:hypothetical protein
VESNIIDGSDWIAKRLSHLRSLLDADVSEEDRKAIEEEIAVLSRELGLACGGPILHGRSPRVPTAEPPEAHPGNERSGAPPVVSPSPRKRSRRGGVVGEAGTWPD